MRPLFSSRRRAPLRGRPGLTAPTHPARRAARPRLEALEDRLCPTIHFAFDYSLDATGFFNVAARRAALETAGQILGAALNDSLAALVPGGGNTWTAQVTDPSTGATLNLPNLVVPGDTLVIYAGGRNYGGTTVGEGGPGGWSASGSSAWINLVSARGQNGALSPTPTDFGPWGGSVSFDTATNWNFDTTHPPAYYQTDFLSVAEHELGHILGIGTAGSWFDKLSGGYFLGPAAFNAYGTGQYPAVDAAGEHFAQGTLSGGAQACMTPVITPGTQKTFTPLDYAALQDVGWQVGPTTPANLPVVAWALSHSAEHYSNFVTAAYQRYLGRSPDPAGLAGWVSAMQQGLTDEGLESNFVASAEYVANHGGPGPAWVSGVYHDLLGRAPSAAEADAWASALGAGEPAGQLAYGLAAGAEREAIRVRDDYLTYLGRAASQAEVNAWVGALVRGAVAEDVVACFLCSAEYWQGHSGNASAWLTAAYQDVLGRDPEPGAYAAWLPLLS